jgi:hypothetical protein
VCKCTLLFDSNQSRRLFRRTVVPVDTHRPATTFSPHSRCCKSLIPETFGSRYPKRDTRGGSCCFGIPSGSIRYMHRQSISKVSEERLDGGISSSYALHSMGFYSYTGIRIGNHEFWMWSNSFVSQDTLRLPVYLIASTCNGAKKRRRNLPPRGKANFWSVASFVEKNHPTGGITGDLLVGLQSHDQLHHPQSGLPNSRKLKSLFSYKTTTTPIIPEPKQLLLTASLIVLVSRDLSSVANHTTNHADRDSQIQEACRLR